MTIERFLWKLNHPKSIIQSLLIHTAKLYPDRLYLRWLFRIRVGYKLDLDNPQTFNEKLNWLKLYNRKPKYTQMVDKVEAKKYVANLIGEEYIIPTLGVYNSVEEIDFDKLPNQFVIKCTHDSGGVLICKDKNLLDIAKINRDFSNFLKCNYYYQNREFPYKNVKPRLIAEKYIVDESGYELKDYKFFCFNGEPKALYVASDRVSATQETKFDFYDMDFNHLPFTNGHPNSSKQIAKPKGFEKMKELAAILSQGEPHLRVDFYDINGQIYFGELTFFHCSGMEPFDPQKWDYKLGEWITLPENTKIE